jgi:hypothetical protein
MPSIRSRDGERGQILILFAGGLVVLLLILGLVVDGGTAFVNRRDGQNSADLAALAGTKKLADTWRQASNAGVYYPVGNGAYQAIQTSMTANDCPVGGICTWTAHYVGPRSGATFQDLGPVGEFDATIPGSASGTKAIGIKVDVTRTPRTYFLGVIGQSTWTVGTAATAIGGTFPGAPAGQLLPIAFVDTGTVPSYTDVTALTGGANGPGNFGWVSWTGSNSGGGLATSLCTPNNPQFTLPKQFRGDPGTTNASDVVACLQQWVDNGETVLIPIVYATNDPLAPPGCKTGSTGNNFTFCIKAIAVFKITGYTQPAVDQINGMYQSTYAYSGSVPAGVTAPPTAADKFYYFGIAQ